MYREELDVTALIIDEEGQDWALKPFTLPMTPDGVQTFDRDMLTSLGVVVWGRSVFDSEFAGGGERFWKC